MARKRSDSGGMSLDSLMDTLTNVVGILLIILIFALLGGTEAVKRIKGFVDEITTDQLAAKVAEATELRQTVEAQRALWSDAESQLPEQRLTLEEQQRLLAQLRADLEQLAASQVDPAQLESQLAERRARAEELRRQVDALQATIASLKARLAETVAQGAGAETKVVNLPDPRPAPTGATAIIFGCRHGFVFPIDVPALQAEAQQVMAGAQRQLFREEGLDCEKLKELFEKRIVGDKYVRLGIRTGGDGKPYLLVNHREDEGEPTENISRRTSLFNQALERLNPQTQFIEFRVWSDSYDTYLAARNEAAARGIAAGWIPYDAGGEYWIGVGVDVMTTCIGYVPPPPTPPAPANPNAPPPPPADQVD